jgi:hypothetical protein
MKKILILAASFVGAVGAFAQGTVIFADNSASTGGALQVQIFAPSTTSPNVEVTGNTAGDTPAGNVTYSGVPLGGSTSGSGAAGYGNGGNYTAELYALGGTTPQAFSALQPVSQYTSTFFTVAAGAGLFRAVSPASDPGIPNTPAGSATISVAAWYSGGGTYPTLTSAETAGVPYGWATPFLLSGLGNVSIGGNPPGTPPPLNGLTSFSLVTPVPEPGTITLALMGAGAFLARRRSSK